MAKLRLNCWEFTACGRQPGGKNASKLGVCPAAEEKRLDGIHGGKNAGRSCWVVAETLCKGEVQGEFAKKFKNCSACNFYTNVKKDEFPNFQLSATLMRNLA